MIISKGARPVTLVAPPPIPKAAGSLPLLGHAVQLMRDNLAFIASLRENYGPLAEITLQPGTRTLIVQDPELIRTMLVDLGPGLDKGRFFEKMGQLLGDSVVTAAGQEHVHKRRQLQPASARPEIARYVDIMRGETTTAVDTWTPGQTLDVREAMVKLSLDMLAKTVFSGSLDEQTFRRLRQDLSVVMNGVGARIMLPDRVERLPLPFNRRFTEARDAVRATIGRAVAELQASGHDSGDMLSLLLSARDEETGQQLSGSQICPAGTPRSLGPGRNGFAPQPGVAARLTRQHPGFVMSGQPCASAPGAAGSDRPSHKTIPAPHQTQTNPRPRNLHAGS
ncbi:cytochrome P450 [Streptomyces sp. NPDC059862]|uniref:cytochrome P450 n=1 Tax=unclassified Streptomyces TaxID=2593676 RepID=UPI003642ECCE